MVDLTLGGFFRTAYALNGRGQVVGSSQTASGASHAFSWTQAGGMVDLGTLPGGSFSRAVAVNDRGQVVGTSQSHISNSSGHAVLWQPRVPAS